MIFKCHFPGLRDTRQAEGVSHLVGKRETLLDMSAESFSSTLACI